MIRALLRGCRVMLAAVLLTGTLHAADDETAALLAAAASAFAAKHYIYPASGSAMALYHDVLALEPDNAAALQGLGQIVELFLVQATDAIATQQYIKAEGMVSRARQVDPDNPNIEPIALELRLLEQADRQKTTLNWRLVADRSDELAPLLRKLGAQARQPGCQAIISVSNDAEGRWIYQQLSKAPGDRRIQAQLRISSPAAVEVLCVVSDNEPSEATAAPTQ